MAGFPRFALPQDPLGIPVRRCRLQPARASRRVLIQSGDSCGDTLMATPLLEGLRDAWPEAHLTWAVEDRAADTLTAHPCLDALLLWDSAFWQEIWQSPFSPRWQREKARLRRLLAHQNYEIYIALYPEGQPPLLVQCCGAPLRIGVFGTKQPFSPSAPGRARLQDYTRAFTSDDLPLHRSEQYLLPLQALGLPPPQTRRMTLAYTVTDEGMVRQQLAQLGLAENRAFVLLAPGSRWESRRWPADRYAGVADGLRAEGIPPLLVGTPEERLLLSEIAGQMRYPALELGENLSLRQLAALISRASLVISGDTAALQMAAALETPSLALFGPRSPAVFAPRAQKGRTLHNPLPCSPCYQSRCPYTDETGSLRCLRQFSVAEVLTAARELLAEPAQTQPQSESIHGVQR